MSKEFISKTCCICLECSNNLSQVTSNDGNKVTLKDKLKTCVPDVEWLDAFLICETCAELLNTVYGFREVCLKSEEIRKKLESNNVKEVRTDSDDNYLIYDVKNIDYDNDDYDLDSNFDTKEEKSSDVDDDSIEEKPKIKKEKKSDQSNNETKKRRKYVEFNCEKCGKVFKSSTKLVTHCIEQHDMTKKDVKPFECGQCLRRFRNSSNLLQHVKYHEAIRSNTCSFCGKGFITKGDVALHEKQHLNKREYECTICKKNYNTHKDLRSHFLVVHTDPMSWKFWCQVCDKRFPIKSNYDCHIRRHTGERNFVCHLCSRKFAEKCVLQRHMKTHSNVREFRCSECKKEYKDKRVMLIHMAKIHGIGADKIKLPIKEKKYQCHVCPKAYFAKNKLVRHLYTHTGEKPFSCTICPKKFNDKSYVSQHMKKAHSYVVKTS